MAAVEQELGLQLVAGVARRGLRPEVREPLQPRARNAAPGGQDPLGSAVGGSGRILLRAAGGHPGRQPWLVGPRPDHGLVPDLVHDIAAPVADEQARAVRAGGDGVEVGEHVVPRGVDEDVLAHRVRGDHLEGQLGDDPERPEGDHRAREVAVRAVEVRHLAVRPDPVEGGDRGGEDPVAVARAVRPGRRGPTDRDVRQRGHVLQGQPLRVERQGELRVGHARRHRDGAALAVDVQPTGHFLHVDENAGGVGDRVERVPCTQRLDPVVAADELLQLLDRARRDQLPLPELDVAGPVRRHRRPLARSWHDHATPGRRPARRPAAEAI